MGTRKIQELSYYSFSRSIEKDSDFSFRLALLTELKEFVVKVCNSVSTTKRFSLLLTILTSWKIVLLLRIPCSTTNYSTKRRIQSVISHSIRTTHNIYKISYISFTLNEQILSYLFLLSSFSNVHDGDHTIFFMK